MELRVKELCKEKNIYFKDLADKIGVSDIALRKQVQGNPTIGTLQKIARALNVEIWELFVSPEEIAGKTRQELIALIRYKDQNFEASTIEELEKIVNTIKGKE